MEVLICRRKGEGTVCTEVIAERSTHHVVIDQRSGHDLLEGKRNGVAEHCTGLVVWNGAWTLTVLDTEFL